jgi:hypothetical protein
LAFQILAMARMQASNNEERFVLASLKEFVKTWGTGRAGSFQLVCEDGRAKLSMEFHLEKPGNLHFTPPDASAYRDTRRKNPSRLRRDKKRADQRQARMAGSAPAQAASQAQQAVGDAERADQPGDVSPDPAGLAALTLTANSKKKKKKSKRKATGSDRDKLYDLDFYRTPALTWNTTRAVPALQESVANFYNSGTETVETGGFQLPLDPPLLWEVDTGLWAFVLASGRDVERRIAALQKEIHTRTGPRSPLMREFWAALSLGMTVFSCQDGVHLGWRRRPGLDAGLGGSSWTVEQVRELRAWLWATETNFTERLWGELTSHGAEMQRTETICMKSGRRVSYETLGSDSWVLRANR